jgi:uncharacterized protein
MYVGDSDENLRHGSLQLEHMRIERFEVEGDVPVRGFLHRPERSSLEGLVLTHGAGANCQAPLLVALATAFSEAGVMVLRCDLPFRIARPHGPPMRGSAERDQQGLRRAVEALKQEVSRRVYIGGHSYGGRQASMLAALDSELVDGLLLLSYPLHPPKQAAQMRTAHFPSLRTPALFFSGSRDGFGTVEEMTAAVALIPAKTRLVTIEGAGHELMSKKNAAELPGRIVEEFGRYFG